MRHQVKQLNTSSSEPLDLVFLHADAYEKWIIITKMNDWDKCMQMNQKP